MPIQNDETLQMYLEESFEHLANIENDLLAIESDGAEINEELVNKVYRAAHSIKGGAGFMGLTNIKNLTHEMENILGKIRSREITPEPDIVNVLLKASDTLKALMNDVLNSNDANIHDHIDALRSILKTTVGSSKSIVMSKRAKRAAASTPEKSPTTGTDSKNPDLTSITGITISFALGKTSLSFEPDQLRPQFEQGKCVYLVMIRIKEDILNLEKSCRGVLEEMEQTGMIVAANFDATPSAQLEENWRPAPDELLVVFATILKPSDINVLFEIEEQQIMEIRADFKRYDLQGRQIEDATAEKASQTVPTRGNTRSNAKYSESGKKTRAGGKVKPPKVKDDTAPAMEPAPNSNMAASDTPDTTMEGTNPARQTKLEQESSLRVHVSLLDQLMTLAGELVLSRNQLLQSMASNDQRGSEIAGQRIDLITSELQEAIMLTRMQSIGNVFNKFPRVVRDLARGMGKQIELTLEGSEVELDKTIIEAIGDPLIHLVRNAVDHGIEKPEMRRKLGKNLTGQVFLKAYHEAGQVNIEITDDGCGLDGHRLAAKAVEKGLITEEQAKIMSAREKTNLIFLPGFSTADKVTDVSGRGVGMDVVKTNLDRLGGIIDIDSEIGHGTTIKIKLPLTLAIIPCQIVLTGGERYAIPQVNLEELLRIPAAKIRERIERVGNADVVRLRGNLLPLIRLADVIDSESIYIDPESGAAKLNRRKTLADRRAKKSFLIPADEASPPEIETPSPPPDEPQARKPGDRRYHSASALNIVVVSTGAMKYGLVVDELHDSEEIVVKPLGRDLKKCKGYAGATIMGDGRVALILDVSNLAQMAGLISMEGTARAAEVANDEREVLRTSRDKQSLLIFRSSEKEQFAAPLNLVERIEKIKLTDIEEVGGKRVIKYRGGSLSLFSIDEAANVKPLADAENLLVIVFIVAGRELGLLAMGPVDAVETSLEIDGRTLRQPGIMGSAIINDHTTLLIDIHEIVQTLNPQWFQIQETVRAEKNHTITILFAEDSNFFRNQVKGSMEKEGFDVIEAEDGVIAWNLLQENSDRVQLVVTDLEMPNMDGFALTKRIKESPTLGHLPVIALTTLAGDEDIARGKSVGIDDYQIKLDREKLMQSIFNFMRAA
jgi:two-component system, chemotaxis family, sensor kinase CheA